MRRFLFILSLLCVSQLYGQEIELQGRYTAFFLASETIDFVGTDSFYFYGSYCESGIKGKGRCEVRDGYLYLNFEKKRQTPLLDSLHMDKIDKEDSIDSFAVFKITCLNNNNGAPTPFATVTIKKRGKAIVGTAADMNGIAELRIRKDIFPIELNISSADATEKQIKIKEPANYSIKCFSQSTYKIETLNNGEQFIFEIEEVTEDMITMRLKNSGDPFRKYRKRKRPFS